MKISLKLKGINIHPDYEIDPPDMASPLAKAMQAATDALNSHPALQNIKRLINPANYPDVDFPDPDSEYEIEVVLCKSASDLQTLCDLQQEHEHPPIGYFSINAGAFEPDCYLSDAFRVIVACDEDFYRDFVSKERQEEVDPGSDSYDRDYLAAYLITISHEIVHAIEFIEHGGGFTPHELEALCDDGAFDFCVNDAATGLYARPEMQHLFDADPSEITQAMEDRVEEKGRSLMHWAMSRIPDDLIEECVSSYAPRNAVPARCGP